MFALNYKFGQWFIELKKFKSFQDAWDYTTKVHLAEYNIRGCHLDVMLDQGAFVAEKNGVITKYFIHKLGENIVIDF